MIQDIDFDCPWHFSCTLVRHQISFSSSSTDGICEGQTHNQHLVPKQSVTQRRRDDSVAFQNYWK
jgi:hypothetical protein